jgi:hypothetical protein
MISIWSRFANYWQSKGWLWMLITAISILAACWLISERNNIEGTYDRFDITLKNQDNKIQEQQYFPQSINYGSPYPTKRKVPQNSKGEEICRNTLQHIFKQPFPKCRPDFLYNSVTGENLELDMYNKYYGLAVEYNGQQHYKYNSFMHGGSKDKFYGQQYRDKMKKDICKKLGITLIEVPYTVKHDDIPNFLVNKLREYQYID